MFDFSMLKKEQRDGIKFHEDEVSWNCGSLMFGFRDVHVEVVISSAVVNSPRKLAKHIRTALKEASETIEYYRCHKPSSLVESLIFTRPSDPRTVVVNVTTKP